MDINEIKNSALEALRSIFNVRALWGKAVQAMQLPYAKAYVLLAVILTLLFWVITFPFDVIIRSECSEHCCNALINGDSFIGLLSDLGIL